MNFKLRCSFPLRREKFFQLEKPWYPTELSVTSLLTARDSKACFLHLLRKPVLLLHLILYPCQLNVSSRRLDSPEMRDRGGVYFRLTIVSHVSLKTTAKLIKSVWRVNSTWILFLTNFYNQFSQPIIKFLVVSDIENIRIDLGKCNSTFTFDCDYSVSLHCPFRPTAHDVFILVFGGIRDSFLF